MIRSLKFPWRRGVQSLPEALTDAEVVSQNIREIILAAPGEREMLPGWGGGVAALLFDNTVVAAELAKRSLMEAITNYEPRALISEISFTIEDTAINMKISFMLRSTGEAADATATLQKVN